MISEFGGLAKPMPWFSTLFVIASLSSIGLPFLNGFVGEFLILIGTWTSRAVGRPWIMTMLAATGVIWAAVYMLWMLQRVVFGTVTNPENERLSDLNSRELGLLLPLLFLMLFMGVYPRVFLDRSKASVETVRARVSATRQAARTRRKSLTDSQDQQESRNLYVKLCYPKLRMNSFLRTISDADNQLVVNRTGSHRLCGRRARDARRCIRAPDAALDHGRYFTRRHRCRRDRYHLAVGDWNGGTAADAFNGMIVLDELRLGFTLIFLLVSGLTLLAFNCLGRRRELARRRVSLTIVIRHRRHDVDGLG